jgi:sporulation protein YlmC with PRC-barrel domain
VLYIIMISEEHDLREKKLRGSGGYVFAKVTDEEQKRGNLGGPELFLAGIGRLPDERFSKYFCNKCEKEYEGSPSINYENPNEDLGEGVTLAEKGEYRCATCDNTLAQYRKFDTTSVPSPEAADQQSTATSNDNAANIAVGDDEDQIRHQSPENADAQSSSKQIASQESVDSNTASISPSEKDVSPKTKGDAMFHPIHSLIGMPAYDSEAILIGKVQEIGLRKATTSGNTEISIKIIRDDSNKNDTSNNVTTASTIEILWGEISKIGDIVLLNRGPANSRSEKAVESSSTMIHGSQKCFSCGYQNEKDAMFCEECGKKLENK